MKSMYERLLSEIKTEYKKIVSTEEKIEFLLDKRRTFKAENTTKEAKIIIQWFTDEIEKIKLLRQLESKSEKPTTNIHPELFEIQSLSEKYEQTIRVTKIATKEDIERFNQWQGNTLKVGDKYSIIPEPNNKEELFERFEKLHAQRYFETLQDIFNQKYGEGNEKIIKDELSALKGFIERANKLSTAETFKNKWVDPKEADLYEYSRLANNYYKNPQLPFYPLSYFNNNAVLVYAKYFLYKQWLEDKLDELKKKFPTQQTTEQMKENLLQSVACSKGDEIIDEIDKIYLDKSLLTGRKIVLIGDRKDIFKLGEKHIKDGVASISFDKKEYIFPEWKIKDIVDCCKDRLRKLKRWQTEETLSPQLSRKNVENKSNSFVQLLITGIKELQERGVKEPFIFNLKNSNEKDESGFRDWFSVFFQRHGFVALPERKKEKGRIDLIVKHDDFGEKKIEFKIWYNPDKKEIVNQIYSYLTDFNNEGYIFMINDMKSQIIEEYKCIVTQNLKNNWDGTWDILNNDGYEYFKSGHNIGANLKTIYHFNFNIYP